jgi:two-component system response regulator CpxR
MTKNTVLWAAEPTAHQQLIEYLQPRGFALQIIHEEAALLPAVLQARAAALVLAAEFPSIQLFDLLRAIRQVTRLPVLLLLAAADEMEGIIGLELGADDYLLQPVNPRILAARLRAILRRTRAEAEPLPPPGVFTKGVFRLNEQARQAWLAESELALTTIEFDLLRAFLGAAGQPLSRETLSQAVLGRAFHPTDRSVDVHISNLRRKLGLAACIKALRGIGYVFTALA